MCCGWLKPKERRFQHVSKLSKADIWVSQFRKQIVPDSRSANRKVYGTKTVLCPRNDACSVAGWSKEMPSAVRKKRESSVKYWGVWPDSDLYIIQASLNHTRWWTGSQCSCTKTHLKSSCSNYQQYTNIDWWRGQHWKIMPGSCVMLPKGRWHNWGWMLPRDVDALGNTDYLSVSRDACRTNHNRVFLIVI